LGARKTGESEWNRKISPRFKSRKSQISYQILNYWHSLFIGRQTEYKSKSLQPEDGGSVVLRKVGTLPRQKRHHNPEDPDVNLHRHETLSSHTGYEYFFLDSSLTQGMRISFLTGFSLFRHIHVPDPPSKCVSEVILSH